LYLLPCILPGLQICAYCFLAGSEAWRKGTHADVVSLLAPIETSRRAPCHCRPRTVEDGCPVAAPRRRGQARRVAAGEATQILSCCPSS
jgi:hypothetical protein